MKKIFQSRTNLSHKLGNFWFAMQLLIVAVSLPVMSVIQISHSGKSAQLRQYNETVKKSKQNLLDANLLERAIDLHRVN